ncbi:zinc-binding dehydrogenase [Bradyrhizobium liaoningense]
MSWLPRKEFLGSRRVDPVTLTVGGRIVTTPDIFTWTEQTVADEAYLYPTSSNHPALSVLGCAVVTGVGAVMNSARIKPGDTVAVIGTGGVGGSAIVAARALGAGEIFAIDLNEEKLALARRLGATQFVNTGRMDLARTTLIEQSSAKAAAQSIRKVRELNWTPLHVIGGSTASVETVLRPAGLKASKGPVTTLFLKQPGDPAWTDDAEVKAYHDFLKKVRAVSKSERLFGPRRLHECERAHHGAEEMR